MASPSPLRQRKESRIQLVHVESRGPSSHISQPENLAIMNDRLEKYATLPRGSLPRPEASNAASDPMKKFSQLVEPLEAGLRSYPVVTIGVGLAIGALVGWFIKRK